MPNITSYQLRTLLCALEDPEGVDAAPTAQANALLLIGGEGRIETNRLERQIDYPYFTGRPFVRTQLRAIIQGQIELMGSATLGDPAPIDAILQAGGYAHTTVEDGGSPVASEYNPISLDVPSLSAYWFHGGELMRGLGCRVAIEQIRAAINDYCLARIQIQGSPEDITEQQLPTDTDYSSYQDPTPVSTETLTVELDEKALDAISIEHNNNVNLAAIEHSEGRTTRISDRRPSGTLRVYRPAVSHINIRAAVEAQTRLPLVVTIDNGAGLVTEIEYPGVQLGDPQRVDVDGMVAWDIPYVSVADAGNDDHIIRFR